MPKTMYREWDRLNRLNHLYVKDGRVVCAGENLPSSCPGGLSRGREVIDPQWKEKSRG